MLSATLQNPTLYDSKAARTALAPVDLHVDRVTGRSKSVLLHEGLKFQVYTVTLRS
jgi:hypothetical protein